MGNISKTRILLSIRARECREPDKHIPVAAAAYKAKGMWDNTLCAEPCLWLRGPASTRV